MNNIPIYCIYIIKYKYIYIFIKGHNVFTRNKKIMIASHKYLYITNISLALVYVFPDRMNLLD